MTAARVFGEAVARGRRMRRHATLHATALACLLRCEARGLDAISSELLAVNMVLDHRHLLPRADRAMALVMAPRARARLLKARLRERRR